jgi:hypothetical protein
MLRLRWGPVADRYEEAPWPFPMFVTPDPLDGEPFPDELLRFGVQFADGRRVTDMGHYPLVPEGLAPDQHRGPVAYVCAWPGRGIASSRLEVDGTAIRAAADDAVTLWLDDPFCSND